MCWVFCVCVKFTYLLVLHLILPFGNLRTKPPNQPAGRTGYFSSVFANPGGDLEEKTMSQKHALLAITIGLLLAGYLDGQDAKLMEKPIQVACIKCGQP